MAFLPFPPPLDEGINEEKYEAFLRTPPASPTEEVMLLFLMKAYAKMIDQLYLMYYLIPFFVLMKHS